MNTLTLNLAITTLSCIPIVFVLLYVIRFYVKRNKAVSKANEEGFDQTPFELPTEDLDLEVDSNKKFKGMGGHIDGVPKNYNYKQELTKYNCGTYRNNKGQYESLTSQDISYGK